MLDFDDWEGSPGQPWRPPRERAPPPMDHEAGWKPSAYSEAMGRLILARIQDGETVKQIAASEGMPSYATIYRWTKVIPEFGEPWRALRVQMARQAVAAMDERAKARAFWRAHKRKVDGRPPRDWVSRRSSYTGEKGDAVCIAIVEGAALSHVVKRPGMPSAKVVYTWLRTQPEFRRRYRLACEMRAELFRDEALEAAMACTEGTVRQVKRRLRELEGQVGRMAPRKWREK